MRAEIFKDVTAPRNQALWLILGFQAGFMNAGGFLACHQYVSHMTGYGTSVGLALGEKRYQGAFELAMAPLFFLTGAAWAGWLVDRKLLQGREPKILTGIVAVAALNLAVYLGEITGFLGEFGEPLVFRRDFELLFALCFACGLQNGLFTGVTKGQVRTTHMTGPITDIGINLAKVFTLDREDPERARLAALNWLRTKIVIAFSGGSLIATVVFASPDITYEGFAVPCATSLFLLWYLRRLSKLDGGLVAPGEGPESLLIPANFAGREGRA